MTTLSANLKRRFEFEPLPIFNDVPMVGTDTIFEGAAVGESSSLGLARPLVAADSFMGFAVEKAINAGAASAQSVRISERGRVKLSVTGVTSEADHRATVYADDDNAFTLTNSSNSTIGKVARWISGTTCIVAYESVAQRSI